MSDSVHVKGLADLQKFLDELPVKVEKNIMRGALRAGMNEIKPAAQQNIHSVSGLLARGLKVGTRTKGGIIMAYLRAAGLHGWLARFVEFGTGPHMIAGSLQKPLVFGGRVVSLVRHPGARPRPFLRPALDQKAQAAVVAAGNYVKNRLATKQGLDTSGVTVEGDEP